MGFKFPPYWIFDESWAGLIQVHDLVAPVDFDTSAGYLQRLGAIAGALLANRDDVAPFFEDPFRGRVMPAWGAYTQDRDCKWNTDPSTSGLFAYTMAAFARRVAERPERYPQLLKYQAVRMITAVIETYEAFRPELHLVEGDPHAFWVSPERYSTLECAGGNDSCENYRAGAGQPIAYNESLAMVRALSELAPPPTATCTGHRPMRRRRACSWRRRRCRSSSRRPSHTASPTCSRGRCPTTPCYEWHYQGSDRAEDIHHAQFELGCLAVVLEGQLRLNDLLERAGRAERVPLTPSIFERLANTFLRIVWRNNLLAEKIDGSGDAGNTNECAGWVPLAQFDPWVWTRARDTTFNASSPGLRPDNHGALLRYRKFNSMKYLTHFAGQNWLITPAALAVGEQPPPSIRDQKWLLILSGIVLANQRGDNSGSWNHETVSFIPDMAGPDAPTATSGPLNWAIARYGIPRPAGTVGQQYLVRFSVDEWAPFVSLSSVLRPGTFGERGIRRGRMAAQPLRKRNRCRHEPGGGQHLHRCERRPGSQRHRRMDLPARLQHHADRQDRFHRAASDRVRSRTRRDRPSPSARRSRGRGSSAARSLWTTPRSGGDLRHTAGGPPFGHRPVGVRFDDSHVRAGRSVVTVPARRAAAPRPATGVPPASAPGPAPGTGRASPGAGRRRSAGRCACAGAAPSCRAGCSSA